jgi:hypothetical protein
MTTQITGRDVYIESEAFVLAIGYIQSLPRKQQSWSNMNDMCRILRAKFYPGNVIIHIVEFYRRTGFLINLCPDDEDDNIDDEWRAPLDESVRSLIKQMTSES